MGLTLVIDEIIAEERTYKYNKTLRVVDPNKAEVTVVYFAEKEVKYVDELSTHTYTFDKKETITKVKEKMDLVNKILKATKSTLKKDGKETSTAWIQESLSKTLPKTYNKTTDTITFKVKKTKKKEEVIYKKIDDAYVSNQVYLIAETKELEGKKVKVKIHEKGIKEKKDGEETVVYNLLKDENVILSVLVYAKKEDKTTDAEASDWIEIDIKKEKGKKDKNDKIVLSEGKDIIEIGIKKIQLRPKKDKMASKTEEANKSFEGWAEKLYIREDETADGKKAKEDLNKKINGNFINLVRDKDANDDKKVKNYPKLISGPKKVNIGEENVYTLESYSKTNNEGDKKNIRWSLYVQGETKPLKGKKESHYISTKSKPNLYTYAKMELVGGKNKLTIIFDKALKGKKIQIEPFRGEPGLSIAKDYVRTTKILAKKAPKIVEKKNVKLWLETECNDCTKKGKEFLNGGDFTMKALGWHEPVDNPQIPLWNSEGNIKPQSNTFGTGRNRLHTGLDIFAIEGSNAYACLDAVVYKQKKHGGYGHTITLKINNPNELVNRKKNYTHAYKTDKNSGSKFKQNESPVYLFYAHLQDVFVKEGDNVIAGTKIGLTGISGVTKGTYDPHLHFNIFSTVYAVGKQYKDYLADPALYVRWKTEKQLTKEDRKTQENRKNKGKLKNANPKLTIK